MGYGIGSVLSVVVSVFARIVGLDRDRAFYPTVAIVVPSYYVLFAVMGGTTHALIVESSAMSVFLTVAVAGFRRNLWMVAAALAGHGVFDFFHAGIVTNAGMPEWWPAFCGAYDVCAAGCLAWLLMRAKISARTAASFRTREGFHVKRNRLHSASSWPPVSRSRRSVTLAQPGPLRTPQSSRGDRKEPI